jgi:hypothetical protein
MTHSRKLDAFTTTERLRRAATHEAAHAVSALHFMLPLKEVLINDDGSGSCGYERRLSWGEIDRFVMTGYAGPLAERAAFGSADERGDLRVIETMLRILDLHWSDAALAEYREKARALVELERGSISVLADALMCRRHLTADQVGALMSSSAGLAPMFGSPAWISP